MIKRRRRAGSAPKYRNQGSTPTRSASDTETSELLRNEQETRELRERKPSLKKLKTKIIQGKNNLLERKRKISENVDRKIHKMKTKMKQKVYNIAQKLPNRKRLSGNDKYLSTINGRRSGDEDNFIQGKRTEEGRAGARGDLSSLARIW